MDMYRRMLRISWTEHRTNNSILEELEPACRFLADVRRRKLQYFGHVVRADNLCTHVLHGIVVGKRSRGRPRRRWTDDIKQWTGISVAGCVQHAKDRSVWRALVSVSGQWPPILSHEDGPRQGKARQGPTSSERLQPVVRDVFPCSIFLIIPPSRRRNRSVVRWHWQSYVLTKVNEIKMTVSRAK